MAGSILGKDQIIKINQLYKRIFDHVKVLVAQARTPYEVMKVHFLLEQHDTTELFEIFRELPFLSPKEKEALMRAAIFDVLLNREPAKVDAPQTDAAGVSKTTGAVPLSVYTPPAFKLNVATTEAVKTVVPPTPPTQPHTPIVQPQVQEPIKLNVATTEDHQVD